MKLLGLLLALFICCSFQSKANDIEDVMVVTSSSSFEAELSKRQIRDIFMGNSSTLPLTPLSLRPSNRARYIFNTKVVGLTESRIQSYWAQMRFSGRNKPPKEFDSVEALLAYMQNNKDTVAYLPVDTKLPSGMTMIYTTGS